MKRTGALLFLIFICVMAFSLTVFAERDVKNEERLAGELKTLGLFKGVSDTDFDLDRAPTRVEAVIMLIRVLGKESEVLNDTWLHPFTDVPAWADKYIGYAYSKGLTNGQSNTLFGTGNANAQMYTTFVLRALGYSDANGADFVWNNPFDLAKKVGILPDAVNVDEFWRADVVLISHSALISNIKDTTTPLYQKLISAGVFTSDLYEKTYNKSEQTKTILNAEEIYAKCSPAVFYIENYDKDGQIISSGSGFFINVNGCAVTNFHVIEGAYSAKIQISDTGDVYNVVGVLDYNKEEDWAIIQTDCEKNSSLTIGDASTVVGGAEVYAIGSPLGLQNTISQGIISNPARVDGNNTYIQITAPISSGSSGGALINKYGEVIGITSAVYLDGQNLNLALPITIIADYKNGDLAPLHSLIALKEFSPKRKAQSIYLLENFVLENYTSIHEDGEYIYTETFESDDDGETIFETYRIIYDPLSDFLAIYVSYDRQIEEFRYVFSIERDSNTSYCSYSYITDNKSENTRGDAMIYCAEYNLTSYKYMFDEYEGNDLVNDEYFAQSLHLKGLVFFEYIFFEYLSDSGFYDSVDLGYINILN